MKKGNKKGLGRGQGEVPVKHRMNKLGGTGRGFLKVTWVILKTRRDKKGGRRCLVDRG